MPISGKNRWLHSIDLPLQMYHANTKKEQGAERKEERGASPVVRGEVFRMPEEKTYNERIVSFVPSYQTFSWLQQSTIFAGRI